MESPDPERQRIVDYMASQARNETVEHLEKVAQERILGREMDVWDVHTDKGRWWVITSPTNLYSQAQIPSMDVALSFHAGLMARVEERQERKAPTAQAERFPTAWRQWEQAGEALDDAQEAHDFQAIGMRCREVLLAFSQEASALVTATGEMPKAGDFVGWAELIANAIAPGAGAERRRGYLKAIAKATWEFVNWLTHATDADRFDGYFAHRATGHVLSAWTLCVFRHESPDAAHCPECGSYRLKKEYARSDESADYYVTVCRVCGWSGDPEPTERREPPPGRDAGERDQTPCITIDVPLGGPKPPKPTGAA